MQHFQDIFFTWIRTYSEVLKSALVYLKHTCHMLEIADDINNSDLNFSTSLVSFVAVNIGILIEGLSLLGNI